IALALDAARRSPSAPSEAMADDPHDYRSPGGPGYWITTRDPAGRVRRAFVVGTTSRPASDATGSPSPRTHALGPAKGKGGEPGHWVTIDDKSGHAHHVFISGKAAARLPRIAEAPPPSGQPGTGTSP